jgi:hypothetical protein
MRERFTDQIRPSRIIWAIRNKMADRVERHSDEFERNIDMPGLVSDENYLRFLQDLEEMIRGETS